MVTSPIIILITILAAALFTAVGLALIEGVLVEIVFLALAATFTAPIPALVASVLYLRLLDLQSDSSASAAAESPPAAT